MEKIDTQATYAVTFGILPIQGILPRSLKDKFSISCTTIVQASVVLEETKEYVNNLKCYNNG